MSLAQEQAVRSYLQFLEDPSSAVDPSRLGELEAKIRESHDPIEKLKLMTAIDGLADMAGATVKSRFVKSAMVWATAHGVKTKSFLSLGVPMSVLAEAGFPEISPGVPLEGSSQPANSPLTSEAPSSESDPSSPTRLVAPRHNKSVKGTGRKNRPGVSTAVVETNIFEKKDVFTVREIVQQTGATPATVTKTLVMLVAKGTVGKMGVLETASRGKAPVGYQVTGKS